MNNVCQDSCQDRTQGPPPVTKLNSKIQSEGIDSDNEPLSSSETQPTTAYADSEEQLGAEDFSHGTEDDDKFPTSSEIIEDKFNETEPVQESVNDDPRVSLLDSDAEIESDINLNESNNTISLNESDGDGPVLRKIEELTDIADDVIDEEIIASETETDSIINLGVSTVTGLGSNLGTTTVTNENNSNLKLNVIDNNSNCPPTD